jgi:hypothetical protein
MRDTPDDSDGSPRGSQYDYFLAFYMHGVGRRFTYEVSRASFERVRETLEDDDVGVVVFEAFRPAEQIVINSRFIQLAHFLWQPKGEALEVIDPEAVAGPASASGHDTGAKRGDTVDLYFTGREEPVLLKADDPEEVFDLLLAMETEAFARCSLVDADGQEAVIDLRRLVCAELPLGMGQERKPEPLLELEKEA